MTSELKRFIPKLKNAPHTPVNDGIIITRGLFGESVAFTIEKTINGDVIIFGDKFINKFLEALSTGCIAKMGPAEKELLFAYIRYENGILNRITDYSVTAELIKAVVALDKWIIDEIGKKGHVIANACYNRDFVAIRQ